MEGKRKRIVPLQAEAKKRIPGRSSSWLERNVYVAKGLYLQTSPHSKVHEMGTEQL